MDPDEQRTAIAEACGWESIRLAHEANTILRLWGKSPQGAMNWCPDYLSDLNAMAEAEQAWFASNPSPSWSYARHLEDIVERDWEAGMPDCKSVCFYCATAPQRAEAFLRTVGKWQEAAVNSGNSHVRPPQVGCD